MSHQDADADQTRRQDADFGVQTSFVYRLAICDNSATMSGISAKMAADSGMETVVSNAGADVVALAEQGEVDIVVTSGELADMSGAELCWLLKSIDTTRPPYVILASSDGIATRHAAALDAGADDSIRRPFEKVELQARLRVARRTLNLLDTLQAMAMHDPLTGLHNRRAFHQALRAESLRAQRHSRPLSLIACDLDHFKRINDGYGHAAGDEVLRQCARILNEVTRAEDLTARIGGEEFVVLAPDTNRDDALTLAERLRSAFEANRVRLETDEELSVTGSFGVADFAMAAVRRDIAERTGEAMLSAADSAAYRAKAAGRNRVMAAEAADVPSVSGDVAA